MLRNLWGWRNQDLGLLNQEPSKVLGPQAAAEGDAWFEIANVLKDDKVWFVAAKHRANHWYQQALTANLSGLTGARAKQRLQETAAITHPAEPLLNKLRESSPIVGVFERSTFEDEQITRQFWSWEQYVDF